MKWILTFCVIAALMSIVGDIFSDALADSESLRAKRANKPVR